MAGEAARFQATAKKQIDRFGESVTLRHFTGRVVAAGGVSATKTFTDVGAKLVTTQFDFSQMDGGTIQAGDIKGIFDASSLGSIVPEGGDEVYFGLPSNSASRRMNVVSANSTRVQGVNIIHDVLLRG